MEDFEQALAEAGVLDDFEDNLWKSGFQTSFMVLRASLQYRGIGSSIF